MNNCKPVIYYFAKGFVMLLKCKQYNSRLYCYDKNNKKVRVFLEQNFELDECPKSIIQSFMDDDYDAEIIFKEQEN